MTCTVQPSRRKRSATCEPMKPAPPVTTAVGISAAPPRAASAASVAGVGACSSRREEIARRVDDAEPATVRRRRAQPHRRLVQELVHERLGEVFDCGALLGREVAEPPQRGGQLALAHPVHLVAELRHDGDRREAGDPLPVLLDLLGDHLLGRRQLALPALDVRVHHRAQVVEVVEEDVVHLARPRDRRRAAARCRGCTAAGRRAARAPSRTRSALTTTCGDAVEQSSTSTSASAVHASS